MHGYGISTAFASDLAPEAALAAIAAAGFREIELNPERNAFRDWAAAPAATRRAAEAAGLRVRSVHTPEVGWRASDPDEAPRAEALAANLACLEAAAEAGAEVVIWHPGHYRTHVPPEEHAASLGRSRDALAAIAERAGGLGLGVAVETLPLLGSSRPGASVREVLELIAGFGPRVGACIDVGHVRSNGLEPAGEARLAGRRLLAVHLHDNVAPGRDPHLVPDPADAGLLAFVRVLDEIGYTGGRMFEIAPNLGQSRDVLARLAALVRTWEESDGDSPGTEGQDRGTQG